MRGLESNSIQMGQVLLSLSSKSLSMMSILLSLLLSVAEEEVAPSLTGMISSNSSTIEEEEDLLLLLLPADRPFVSLTGIRLMKWLLFCCCC